MADLPPPYSRDAENADNAHVVSTAAVSPPVLVLPAVPERHPSPPPPSYEMVVQRDCAASSVGETRPQHLLSQYQHQHRYRHRRLSSTASSVMSVSSVRSAPPMASTTATAPLWRQQQQHGESDHQILARIFRNIKSGGGGELPESLGVALHDSALAGSEEHVAALLRANAPIAFTDSSSSSSFVAKKMPNGCALHAALRGAAPHLAVLITDEFWTRAYTAATAPAPTVSTVSLADPVAAADAKTRALLDARDGKGCTPLHMAAQAGITDVAGALLTRGAAVDVRDDLGRTPLHMAARYGRTETAALLLAKGADGDHLLQPALWDRAAAADDEAAKGSNSSGSSSSRTGRGRGGSGVFGRFGTPSRLAELGDFGFIGRLLRPLLADARKRQMELDLDRGDRQAADHAPYQTFDPVPEWDGIGGWGMPDADDDDYAGKPLRISRPSATDGPSHPSLSTSVPASASSFRHADVPLRMQSSSLLPPARARHEAPRRSTGSMLHSPEYSAWRRDCDTLLAEHRAQRERNRLAEVPKGMRI